MEHLIFLVQIISLILAFSSLIILIQNFLRRPDRAIVYFSAALLLMMIRTIIFALARYGNLSRFFVFSVRFPTHFSGGLVYGSLVFFSHFFLLLAIFSLVKKKIPLIVYILYCCFSLYSMIMYTLLMRGVRFPDLPYSWQNVNGLSIVPILSVKAILFICGSVLSYLSLKNRKQALFLILISAGMAADGIFFAFEPFRPLTLFLSVLLPYSAFLLVMPGILRMRFKDVSQEKKGNGIELLVRKFGLTDEERSIVSAIGEGKSNKEIAFDRDTTLSIIKHRIFQLYKKCGINSRWELLSLLSKSNTEAEHV